MLPGYTLIQHVGNVHNKCILLFEARVHIGIPSNVDRYSSTAGIPYPAHTPTVVDILSKHHMICS